jgi:competence protein ComEA
MLTGAERNSLALTLGFLLLGSGIKLWKKAEVEIGPFPTPLAEAAPAGAAGLPVPTQGAAPAPEDSAGAAGASGTDTATAVAATLNTADSAGIAPMAGPAGIRGPGEDRGDGRSRETAPKRKAPPAGKVDPNRATAAELATVPGIGPKIAAAIVAYRREHGPFPDLGRLREVKGIGEKKWAVIAPCLTVTAARGGKPGDTAGTGPERGPKMDGSRGIGGR